MSAGELGEWLVSRRLPLEKTILAKGKPKLEETRGNYSYVRQMHLKIEEASLGKDFEKKKELVEQTEELIERVNHLTSRQWREYN